MRVELATAADEAGLRGLLRQGVMGQQLRLSLAREPDFFRGAATEGDRHHTVVARQQGGGNLRGMGTRAVRRRFVDGQPCRVPYLGALRAAPDWTGNLPTLRRCFDLCRGLHLPDETPYCLTSIVADNERARRLLERGLPGLPRYRPLGRQLTVGIPIGRRPRRPDHLLRGTEADLPEICDLLQQQGRRYQFHPVWDQAEIARLQKTANLQAHNFLLVRRGKRLVGCAAVWDQRPLRQTVVHSWGRGLSWLRPLLHTVAPWGQMAKVPAAGAVLASGFLSHLAVLDDDHQNAACLLSGARWLARRLNLDWLATGFGEGHPLLSHVGGDRRCQRLANMIYLVSWPGDEGRGPDPESTVPLALEVATL